MFVEINGALLYQRRKAMQLTLDKLARASRVVLSGADDV